MKFALPMTVLISPLCAMKRFGCARDQLGKVLVEKRVCISASADSKSGSWKSGKYWASWQGVSMPLYTIVRADRLVT